jgi:hypothetical protein
MRIRVTTRADLFEERKQQHIERGYRIEDERPVPVNGLCSFIAVSEIADSDPIGELVAQVLKGATSLGRVEKASVHFRFSAIPGVHQLGQFQVIEFTGAFSSIADGKIGKPRYN